jgi:FkbM family methyltransferase
MKIRYGTTDNRIDVTDICMQHLTKNNIIIIPNGDCNRTVFFTDPLPWSHKKIFIENNGVETEYDEHISISINLLNNIITTDKEILNNIHSKLTLKYGDFNQELPEQKMSVRYLTSNNKVLEIGGNIGRNSLIIASILQNNNLVTLESDKNIAKQLTENRDLNNFNFHIENSALSNRKLMQKEWNTIPSDTLIEGYEWVNTITLDELKAKYDIIFDTLVLDCEGAFYYILMDMPDILNDITLVIMENDYGDISHKKYIDEILIRNNFNCVYKEIGGWGPCRQNFYEVWTKQ